MGALLSTKSHTTGKESDADICRLNSTDIAAMKKVWSFIEKDFAYYGSIFSTIIFRNHPQYIKYFQEDNIPEFVQDAMMKKKFSAVCSVVSALFIDYANKRQKREQLLAYIAMIHKDMQLSSQDLQNFMMDLLEMLIQEHPKNMTIECTVAHMRYFGGLLRRIDHYMEVYRENDVDMLAKVAKTKSKGKWSNPCRRNPPTIYGKKLDYWIEKKRYWQVRVAVWSSLETELSGMSSYVINKNENEKLRHAQIFIETFGKNRIMADVRDKSKKRVLTNLQSIGATTSGESSNNYDRDESSSAENVKWIDNRAATWYERCKKKKRRNHRQNFDTTREMESIPEVGSRISFQPEDVRGSSWSYFHCWSPWQVV